VQAAKAPSTPAVDAMLRMAAGRLEKGEWQVAKQMLISATSQGG